MKLTDEERKILIARLEKTAQDKKLELLIRNKAAYLLYLCHQQEVKP